MSNEELAFGEFLAGQMKERGFSAKKLSDATGVALPYIETMLRGDFEELPSAPYARGYLMRIGQTLGFDGEAWWQKLRGNAEVRRSGPLDALPKNRFLGQPLPKWVWPAAAVAAVAAAYLAFALPRVLGRPFLAVSYPVSSPFETTSTIIVLRGTVRNADTLYLSNGIGAGSNAIGNGGVGGSASSGAAGSGTDFTASSEQIPIAPDGTWEKTVLLQNGLNTFMITAKKFLGGEANATEQVIYSAPASSTATSTPGAPTHG